MTRPVAKLPLRSRIARKCDRERAPRINPTGRAACITTNPVVVSWPAKGSWTLLAMTIICFVFVVASLARGERNFSRLEWAFAVAAGAVFVMYFFTKQANLAAALTTVVDAPG